MAYLLTFRALVLCQNVSELLDEACEICSDEFVWMKFLFGLVRLIGILMWFAS